MHCLHQVNSTGWRFGPKNITYHWLFAKFKWSGILVSGRGLGRGLVRLEFKYGYMDRTVINYMQTNNYRLRS